LEYTWKSDQPKRGAAHATVWWDLQKSSSG
jgi:hypothetical protein